MTSPTAGRKLVIVLLVVGLFAAGCGGIDGDAGDIPSVFVPDETTEQPVDEPVVVGTQDELPDATGGVGRVDAKLSVNSDVSVSVISGSTDLSTLSVAAADLATGFTLDGLPLGNAYEIETSEGVDGTVEISFVFDERLGFIPAEQIAAAVFIDGAWETVEGSYDPATRTLRVPTDHLSRWQPWTWCWWCIGDKIWQAAGQLLNFRADPPNCAGEAPDWVLRTIAVEMASAPLLYCIESEGERAVVRIVNNRGYPIVLKSSVPFSSSGLAWSLFPVNDWAHEMAFERFSNSQPDFVFIPPLAEAFVVLDQPSTTFVELSGDLGAFNLAYAVIEQGLDALGVPKALFGAAVAIALSCYATLTNLARGASETELQAFVGDLAACAVEIMDDEERLTNEVLRGLIGPGDPRASLTPDQVANLKKVFKALAAARAAGTIGDFLADWTSGADTILGLSTATAQPAQQADSKQCLNREIAASLTVQGETAAVLSTPGGTIQWAPDEGQTLIAVGSEMRDGTLWHEVRHPESPFCGWIDASNVAQANTTDRRSNSCEAFAATFTDKGFRSTPSVEICNQEWVATSAAFSSNDIEFHVGFNDGSGFRLIDSIVYTADFDTGTPADQERNWYESALSARTELSATGLPAASVDQLISPPVRPFSICEPGQFPTQHFAHVTDVEPDDPDGGLVMHEGPGVGSFELSVIGWDVRWLTVHTPSCAVTPDGGVWWELTFPRLTGWVNARYLKEQTSPPVTGGDGEWSWWCAETPAVELHREPASNSAAFPLSDEAQCFRAPADPFRISVGSESWSWMSIGHSPEYRGWVRSSELKIAGPIEGASGPPIVGTNQAAPEQTYGLNRDGVSTTGIAPLAFGDSVAKAEAITGIKAEFACGNTEGDQIIGNGDFLLYFHARAFTGYSLNTSALTTPSGARVGMSASEVKQLIPSLQRWSTETNHLFATSGGITLIFNVDEAGNTTGVSASPWNEPQSGFC